MWKDILQQKWVAKDQQKRVCSFAKSQQNNNKDLLFTQFIIADIISELKNCTFTEIAPHTFYPLYGIWLFSRSTRQRAWLFHEQFYRIFVLALENTAYNVSILLCCSPSLKSALTVENLFTNLLLVADWLASISQISSCTTARNKCL